MNCLINIIPCYWSSKSVVSGAAWSGSVVPAGVKQRVRISGECGGDDNDDDECGDDDDDNG